MKSAQKSVPLLTANNLQSLLNLKLLLEPFFVLHGNFSLCVFSHTKGSQVLGWPLEGLSSSYRLSFLIMCGSTEQWPWFPCEPPANGSCWWTFCGLNLQSSGHRCKSFTTELPHLDTILKKGLRLPHLVHASIQNNLLQLREDRAEQMRANGLAQGSTSGSLVVWVLNSQTSD